MFHQHTGYLVRNVGCWSLYRCRGCEGRMTSRPDMARLTAIPAGWPYPHEGWVYPVRGDSSQEV